jgi:mono/diheme cytochrome c family protein
MVTTRHRVAGLGLLALLAGCASVPHPNAEDAVRAATDRPGTTVQGLEAGRSRYVAKCSGCHFLRAPAKYSVTHWQSTMVKMGDRARLEPADQDAILAYVTSIASRPQTQEHKD